MFSFFQLTFPKMCFYRCLICALFVLLTASVSITVHLPAFIFNIISTSSTISSDSKHISIPPSLIHTIFIDFFHCFLFLFFSGIKFLHFVPPFAFSSQFPYMRFVFYIIISPTSSATTVQYIDPHSPYIEL